MSSFAHGAAPITSLTTLASDSFVPIGFANPNLTDNSEIVGGSAYGAAAIAGGDGSRGLTEKELAIGTYQVRISTFSPRVLI